MPETPYNYDPITPSNTNPNQTPGSLVSPRQTYGHRPPASSDDTVRQTLNYDKSIDYAYGANPSSEAAFCNPYYSSSSASNTHDAVTITATTTNTADTNIGAPYSLAAGSTNAATLPNLNLASFGSQPWPTTSAPYLDFAPQPVYEPTGELVHETVSVPGFHHFDDPTSFGQPTWRSEEETIALQHHPAQSASTPTLSSPAAHKDVQNLNFPKPALKRPLESDVRPDFHPAGIQNPRPPQSDPRKIRRVSFERMSGTGPVSADDEDSSSSEAPSSARATTQTPFRGLPRRGRGSRGASIPAQRPVPQQATSGARPTNSTLKGTKTPTGHPPSILPPEKVFPIQIGSELFRLSGASISSDGRSCSI